MNCEYIIIELWSRTGSNRQPLECHSSALPTELEPLSSISVALPTLKGSDMSSLYKKEKTWYLSMSYKRKRVTKSLKTKHRKVALGLKPFYEKLIIDELTGISTEQKNLSFIELTDQFLNDNHGWAMATLNLNKHILSSYNLGKPLPRNLTSRAIHTRIINQCWNYGIKHKLVYKANKLPGDMVGQARNRTFTNYEIKSMFKYVKPREFNYFIRFAYYTGARSGEIRSISRENLLSDSLVVTGKTGRRIVKLNTQARNIISAQECLWNYKKDYVSHKFKKEVRKLGIRNARFHDLRRTFGLNLIKQGMSIYKVSKLLGHKSVRTTEQHYAPLMTVEIEDFEL